MFLLGKKPKSQIRRKVLQSKKKKIKIVSSARKFVAHHFHLWCHFFASVVDLNHFAPLTATILTQSGSRESFTKEISHLHISTRNQVTGIRFASFFLFFNFFRSPSDIDSITFSVLGIKISGTEPKCILRGKLNLTV